MTLNFLKVNAQNRTGHSGLQKGCCKKLALELHSFFNETPRGDRLPICPFERGPDGLEFWLQGTMLNVAPVSTKYLSFVYSFLRKINPAFAGKCIAAAVACVGLAAESKVIWRQASFLTKHRVERTCEPYWGSNCEIYTRHCQGFEPHKSGWEGGRLLEQALLLLLSPLFLVLEAGLLLRCVEAAVTVWSWLP